MDADTLFEALADATRRRVLQVVARHELAVGEIATVLGKPQSTVSRHLKQLREADLIVERREGPTTFVAAATPVANGNGQSLPASLIGWLRNEAIPRSTERRIESVMQRRRAGSQGFFEQVGERWDQLRSACFGESFHFEALCGLLPRTWTVADIGTGTGYLLPTLAGTFERVIAVEPVAAVMEIARKRVELAGAESVEFRLGELARLPIRDGEVDLAVTMLVVHHVPEPVQALGELARITKPGGRLLLVEQKPHQLEEFHKRMADLWRGFEPDWLGEQARAAGFDEIVYKDLVTAAPSGRSAMDAPELFVMTGNRM